MLSLVPGLRKDPNLPSTTTRAAEPETPAPATRSGTVKEEAAQPIPSTSIEGYALENCHTTTTQPPCATAAEMTTTPAQSTAQPIQAYPTSKAVCVFATSSLSTLTTETFPVCLAVTFKGGRQFLSSTRTLRMNITPSRDRRYLPHLQNLKGISTRRWQCFNPVQNQGMHYRFPYSPPSLVRFLQVRIPRSTSRTSLNATV